MLYSPTWRDHPPRPDMAPCSGTDALWAHCSQNTQLIISLSFFIGKAFTVFDAGFALKTQGSLVKGFTPLRAGFAGLFFSFMFNAPPSLKDPDFFNSSAATAMIPSTTPFTSLAFKPVVSATELEGPRLLQLLRSDRHDT